ncbi:MAG: hypothetical protein Q8P24_02530 [Desulfobacterales bacterium]|nr:hypothetical protein [Desulfobacterales bacterium]
MKTITLEIELEYSPDVWYGDDIESRKFFVDDVLGGDLLLHSQDVGETVGKVTVKNNLRPKDLLK